MNMTTRKNRIWIYKNNNSRGGKVGFGYGFILELIKVKKKWQTYYSIYIYIHTWT